MKKFLALTAVALVAASPVSAQNVVAGFNSTSIAACDDCFTGAVGLGFSANYFGTTYTDTFVSNNGYVTFNAGQGIFTPTGLGAGYGGQPIIAPFFADVDTRNAASALTQYGTGTFAGRNAFGVTWKDVGYFSTRADKTNSFQLLLVDRSDITAGDFDIYFNYDRILWETGSASGGINGFGGVSAAAGFNAAQGGAPGTFGQLAGSLVNGALLDGGANSLVAGSNIGDPGRFLFNVRSGRVTPPTNGAVPEPATWAMMLTGFGLLAASMRRKQAVRVRFAI